MSLDGSGKYKKKKERVVNGTKFVVVEAANEDSGEDVCEAIDRLLEAGYEIISMLSVNTLRTHIYYRKAADEWWLEENFKR